MAHAGIRSILGPAFFPAEEAAGSSRRRIVMQEVFNSLQVLVVQLFLHNSTSGFKFAICYAHALGGAHTHKLL